MNSNNETETNILDPDSINTADVDVKKLLILLLKI